MKKGMLLFKVLVILCLIYLAVLFGAFFKCFKQATAEKYISTPEAIQYETTKGGGILVLPKLNLDGPQSQAPIPERIKGNFRGYREM